MSTPTAGTTAARVTAITSTTIVAAALTFASPASAMPLDVTKYIEVPDCKTTTQVCPIVPSVEYWLTSPEIKVTFTANRNHCAPIIDRILIDGYEWGFRVVEPGQSDGGQIIPIHPVPGYHKIGVKAEGIKVGCNTGYIGAWGGNLRVQEWFPGGIWVR
jgi:hypothetical protein